MHFLPDVYVTCEECHGKRYNRETLEVKYREKSIADVLDMTIEESAEFFKAVPAIRDKMETLKDVGLGYIKVGQPATTCPAGKPSASSWQRNWRGDPPAKPYTFWMNQRQGFISLMSINFWKCSINWFQPEIQLL
jgi:hypothetical protein